MKKLTFITVLALLMIVLAMPVFAADAQAKPFQNFTLMYNGNVQTFEASNPPLNLNGRTMLPLVYMFDLVNDDGTGAVAWDGEARMVTIEYHDTTVKLWIGNPEAQVNGETVSVGEASPVIYNGRTYVPMSFVAGNFDLTVNWDDGSRTAFVIQNDVLKEISDMMDKINEDFEGKIALAMSADMDMSVKMGDLSQDMEQTMEMTAELDMAEKFMHMISKTTMGELTQDSEVYDDGEFMYIVAGEEVIKMPSTLSMALGLESLIATEYKNEELTGLGLGEDKAGNYVVFGKVPMPAELTQSMTNDLLGELGATGIEYNINSLPPVDVVYVIDSESKELISVDMKLYMDISITMSGQTINMVVDCIIRIDDVDLDPTFETAVPKSIKDKAKEL